MLPPRSFGASRRHVSMVSSPHNGQHHFIILQIFCRFCNFRLSLDRPGVYPGKKNQAWLIQPTILHYRLLCSPVHRTQARLPCVSVKINHLWNINHSPSHTQPETTRPQRIEFGVGMKWLFLLIPAFTGKLVSVDYISSESVWAGEHATISHSIGYKQQV